ncbi:unnamed protein product [Phytomonas sp. Hart1]|nr:unnamed protein product [Phytomonas sp. Hart1]|eukprot:CCW69458.1 unnamed protein product [Phytomonas sp. isolate Hart1]
MGSTPPSKSRSPTTPLPQLMLPKGCRLLCENVFEEDCFSDNDNKDFQMRREPTMVCRGSKLLAPLLEKEKRYTVVFDLDETVVYARDGPLYARAYLRDLLRAIKDHFEVIVWTAGEREYAKNVLAEINEDYIIRHLVYRHKKWFHGDDYTKDLRQLGRDLDYTIMIENTPDCVRANPENCIIVADFEVPSAFEDVSEKNPETMEDAVVPMSESFPSYGSQPQRTSTPPLDSNDSSCSSLLPLPFQHPTKGVENEQSPRGGVEGSSESPKITPRSTPKPPRATTDRTLYLLREVLLEMVKSGQTVPEFLARCELLSKQVVLGSNGESIPIHYLGTRRRRKDAGCPKKVLMENRDKTTIKRSKRQETTPTNDPKRLRTYSRKGCFH